MGSVFHTTLLLVNVYSPNWDNVQFVNNLLSSPPCLNTHKLILGSDINCVINPRIDRLSLRVVAPMGMAKAWSIFMEELLC